MSKIRKNDGFWINSQVFRQEAIKFEKNNYYCSSPTGTMDWKDYWDEQLRRCKEGYEADGEKITNHHYFYLNFFPINRLKDTVISEFTSSTKVSAMPDFWDSDYEFFWWLEIADKGVLSKNSQCYSLLTKSEQQKLENKRYSAAEKAELTNTILYKRLKLRYEVHPDYLNGGYDLVVDKARRKGYSYKEVAICVNTYNTIRRSQSLIGVSDNVYADEPQKFISLGLGFLNEHTAWTKAREFKDISEQRRSSFKKNINGVSLEAGYMSEIVTLSFKDNSEKSRGRSPHKQFFEEAGTWTNLKAAVKASQPATRAGKYKTGQIVVFGTGGQIAADNGQFSDIFYGPVEFGCLPFKNVWDKDVENDYCGLFISALCNFEGFYDDQGNTDWDRALAFEEARRAEILNNSSSASAYISHITEFPLCPAESFGSANTTIFPKIELTNQLNKVRAEKLYEKYGTPCEIYLNNGTAEIRPIAKEKAKPIIHYNIKDVTDLTGCLVVYEPVIYNPPYKLYKIGYDPYRQDQSEGVSLGAIYVVKGTYSNDTTKNNIVAEYIGRPDSADDVSRIAWLLALYYNTEVMYENEVTHVKTFFRNIKQLNRLAAQPDKVISKNIQRSTVARIYGCHMNKQLKDAGEKYIRDWLLSVIDFDENGEPVMVYERIYSIRLLKKLIKYNRKGNFDSVMALIQAMMQIQEEGIQKEYTQPKIHKRTAEILQIISPQSYNNYDNEI